MSDDQSAPPQNTLPEIDRAAEEREAEKRLFFAERMLQSNALRMHELVQIHATRLKAMPPNDPFRVLAGVMLMTEAAMNAARLHGIAFDDTRSRLASGANRKRLPKRMVTVIKDPKQLPPMVQAEADRHAEYEATQAQGAGFVPTTPPLSQGRATDAPPMPDGAEMVVGDEPMQVEATVVYPATQDPDRPRRPPRLPEVIVGTEASSEFETALRAKRRALLGDDDDEPQDG